jgi:hypothetical protein
MPVAATQAIPVVGLLAAALGEEGDVLAALAQRRHLQHHPAEALEVCAQRASLHGALEVSVGRGDCASVASSPISSMHP